MNILTFTMVTILLHIQLEDIQGFKTIYCEEHILQLQIGKFGINSCVFLLKCRLLRFFEKGVEVRKYQFFLF